jgi:hypothetical protein
MRVLLPLVLCTGCKRPPEAPTALDDLCAYLFDHMDTEDPEYLQVGVQNLADWLDEHMAETSEGYEISNLGQSSVDDLDDRARDLTGLVGAAVGATSAFSVDDVTCGLTWPDQVEIYPDTYETSERTYLEDPECFLAHDCDTLEADNYLVSSYAGLITVTTNVSGQYRWVETDRGTALVYRTWLDGPAEVKPENLVAVDEQYYLGANYADGNGTVRLMGTWIVAKMLSSDVPDGWALNMVIDSMSTGADELDAWLAAR